MIDYSLIAHSISFYEAKGYLRIESPWTVTEEVSNITKPPEAKNWKIEGKSKVLVASGEQSFLYLYLKGFLPKGKFQTVTPCFRDEAFGLHRTKYFIKNELIVTDDVSVSKLQDVIDDAKAFFLTRLDKVEVLKTDVGFDIYSKGVEIGSYGIRECDYLKWIYGTGCAEPRFSDIIAKK